MYLSIYIYIYTVYHYNGDCELCPNIVPMKNQMPCQPAWLIVRIGREGLRLGRSSGGSSARKDPSFERMERVEWDHRQLNGFTQHIMGISWECNGIYMGIDMGIYWLLTNKQHFNYNLVGGF